MSYVEENLMPNEKVLYLARIHPAIFMSAIVDFLIGAVLGAGAFLLNDQLNAGSPSLALAFLAAFFGLIAVISFFEALITRLTTEFAVTNRRVVAKAGFVRRHTLEMLLQKVESVAVNQGITGRILNYGSLTITGTGGTKERFTAIANPMAVRRYINQILERYIATVEPQAQAETDLSGVDPAAVG
jgi:uncharacterized membrane protein YdbT with pleckstrin-like domain